MCLFFLCLAFPQYDRSENNSTRVFDEKKGRETQIKRIGTSIFKL